MIVLTEVKTFFIYMGESMTKQELIELERIPNIDECNLKSIQEFHDEILAKNIYAYKLMVLS